MKPDLELGISITGSKVCIWPLPPRPRLLIPLSFPGGFKVRGDIEMTTLTDIQKVKIGPVTAVDAKGNPAPIEGVTFTSSDVAIVAVVDNGDGTATATAVGPLGTAQVRVDADAQIGDGVVPLTGLVDLEVVASEAVALSVAVGTPEPA